MLKICNSCKKEFKPSSRHKDCPMCRVNARKTPCIECGKLNQRIYKRCIICHNGPREKNLNWKGGKIRHHANYIMIRIPNHPRAKRNGGYVFEHILVMENLLDKYLEVGETVHHLNGVRDDNRPENLELWVKPQPTGIRAKDALKWAWEIIHRYDGISLFSDDGIRTPGQCRSGPPEE